MVSLQDVNLRVDYEYLVPQCTADGAVSRIDGVDERIAVENYRELVRFMILLLQDAAGAAGETMP
jgi:hypothetical protein